jgi:hypothetical protein
MSQQNEAASSGDVLPWRPGDVILSADGHLYVRVREEHTVGGMWPWHEGVGEAVANTVEGSAADADVTFPVTLLIRDGRPVGGVTVDDRTPG